MEKGVFTWEATMGLGRFLTLAVIAAAAPLWAGGAGYLDAQGRWASFAPQRMAAARAAAAKRRVAKAPGALRYTLVFEDEGTGAGFDDAAAGEARRLALTAAMDYLGTVLDHRGSVDVFVMASEADGTGAPAHGSPLFAEEPGYAGGFAFQHITQIADPCRADNCGEDLPDMMLQVDFGFPYGQHPAAPAAGEYDLFSVLLRELTRGLGFVSLAAADGSSVNGAQTRTRWDDLLYTDDGVKLWNADGGFASTPAELLGPGGGVEFRGARTMARLGQAASVHTPAAFTPDVSLASWGPALSATAARTVEVTPGRMQRGLALFERQALADLGYALRDARIVLFPWVSNNGGQFESVLALSNYGPDPLNVRLTARREALDQEEVTTFIAIPPRGLLKRSAAELFPNLGSGPGYAVVAEADGPSLGGYWVTNNLEALSGASPSQGVAVPVAADLAASGDRAGRHLLFGYLPVTDGFISAPVVVNIGDAPVDVTYYFFNEAGQLVGDFDVEALPPFRPFARVTSFFVGESDGDLYAVASAGDGGLLTGVAFVFNQPESETAIGNATAISFTPPE